MAYQTVFVNPALHENRPSGILQARPGQPRLALLGGSPFRHLGYRHRNSHHWYVVILPVKNVLNLFPQTLVFTTRQVQLLCSHLLLQQHQFLALPPLDLPLGLGIVGQSSPLGGPGQSLQLPTIPMADQGGTQPIQIGTGPNPHTHRQFPLTASQHPGPTGDASARSFTVPPGLGDPRPRQGHIKDPQLLGEG